MRTGILASTHQVTCIEKGDGHNPYERVRSIGGVNYDETRWKLSQQEAIAGIENDQWSFYVQTDNALVWLIVATSAQGYQYLKTKNDGEQPDTLLSLPECP